MIFQMDEDKTSIKIPGERLGSKSEFDAGEGTYIRNGFIYSKLCGKKEINTKAGADKPTICVVRSGQNIVPEVNTVAMCKVINNNPRFSKVNILSVGGTSLKGTFKGIIRKEDVRATQKDTVKMYESFRPGDIVLARILSLGDSQSYFLSTAENELGVIYACSESGYSMIPISWCEMQCSHSGKKEHRKVAKVKIRQV
ncbi:exosome complex component CSL4-like [Clytia hemisphaerica]